MTSPAASLPARLGQAVVADVRSARAAHAVLLVTAIAWIGYEWGPGNETVIPWLTVRILNGDTWQAWAAAVATSATVTIVQQAISGLTVLAAMTTFHRTGHVIRTRFSTTSPAAGWAEASWAQRGMVAFTLGASAVAVAEAIRAGKDARRIAVVQSSLLCGGIVATLAFIVGAGARLGRAAPGTRDAVDAAIAFLGSSVPWLALATLFLVRRALRPAGLRSRPV